MATLPENVSFNTEIEYVSQPSKTWAINRQTMRIQSLTDGLDSVRQAVDIILNTERFKWQIYTSNMGTEIKTLIGDSESYIISEFPRMIEEALLTDDRVTSVEDFVYSTKGDTMTWSFKVNTVFGYFSEAVSI